MSRHINVKNFFNPSLFIVVGVLSVAISLDNQYIVSGSEDRSVKVFDLKSKRELYHFKDIHSGENKTITMFLTKTLDGIRSVAITNNNQTIVSGSEDRSIKILDLLTKQEIHAFTDLHEGKQLFYSPP